MFTTEAIPGNYTKFRPFRGTKQCSTVLHRSVNRAVAVCLLLTVCLLCVCVPVLRADDVVASSLLQNNTTQHRVCSSTRYIRNRFFRRFFF